MPHEHHEEEGGLTPGEQEVMLFRESKDEYMGDDPDSPLTDEQQADFDGLSYYPYNAALRIRTMLDTEVPKGAITMQTSTGAQQAYHQVGKIRFTVGDQPAELMVYASDGGDLFLPLRDATSGKETYGAGRYIEPELFEDGTMLVDFNYLYNPYCAYNDAWSCPLPPVENWLRVPIEAGEKTFGDAEH